LICTSSDRLAKLTKLLLKHLEGLEDYVLWGECSCRLHREDKLVLDFVDGDSAWQSLLLCELVALVAEIALFDVFNVDSLTHGVVGVDLAWT